MTTLTQGQLQQSKTIVHEVSIDDVVKYFMDGYNFAKDEVITRNWYVDQAKGKVAFVFRTVPKAESAE